MSSYEAIPRPVSATGTTEMEDEERQKKLEAGKAKVCGYKFLHPDKVNQNVSFVQQLYDRYRYLNDYRFGVSAVLSPRRSLLQSLLSVALNMRPALTAEGLVSSSSSSSNSSSRLV